MDTAPARDLAGVNWLLHALRNSPHPVVITVCGSCKDVAVAARREPKLFARKCRAVYLNAGIGAPDARREPWLEYNVELDPGAYASMFDVPCPLYWLPCLERTSPVQPDHDPLGPNASWFKFPMREVLPHLAPPLQRFFLSMLDQEPATDWLRSLSAPVDAAKLESWGNRLRNMWCTAGFLHLAGLVQPAHGPLASAKAARADAPYRFVEVQVECDDQGRTRWRPGRSKPPRYKLEVADAANYAKAMTEAIKELIGPLGAA
jgi:hypothetical protein